MTDRAFGFDRSIAIMSGPTTLYIVALTTERRSARSTTRPCSPLVREQWSGDEYSRECPLSADLALPNRLPGNGTIRVDRKLNSGNVIDVLSDLFILRGIPSFIRSDNGPEFVAQAVQDWIKAPSRQIAPQSPARQWLVQRRLTSNQVHLRKTDIARALMPVSAPLCRFAVRIACRAMDECLNGEVFYNLREAQILIEQWRKH